MHSTSHAQHVLERYNIGIVKNTRNVSCVFNITNVIGWCTFSYAVTFMLCNVTRRRPTLATTGIRHSLNAIAFIQHPTAQLCKFSPHKSRVFIIYVAVWRQTSWQSSIVAVRLCRAQRAALFHCVHVRSNNYIEDEQHSATKYNVSIYALRLSNKRCLK